MKYKRITDFGFKSNEEVTTENLDKLLEIQKSIWENEKYYFDEKEFRRIYKFSKKLTPDKGKRNGKLALLIFQFNIITDILCVKKKADKLRRFNEVHINIPRKNGKSFIIGFIMDYLFFFHCEQGSEFIIVANTREQATLLYNQALHFVRETPLKGCCKITDSKKVVYNPSTNSYMRVISSDSSKADSFADAVFCMDEIHECKQPQMFDKLITGQGIFDEPLGVTITTASSGDDPRNLEVTKYKYAKAMEKGEVEDDNFYYAIYEADEGCAIDDREQWYKANPALGKFRKIGDIERLCKQASQSTMLERAFRRFFLNQHVSSEIENAINIELFKEAMCDIEYRKIKDFPSTAGLDLSDINDITAYVQCFYDDDRDKYIIYPHMFTPLNTLAEREKRDKVPYTQWYKEGYIHAFEGEYINFKKVHQYLIAHKENTSLLAFDRWGAAATISALDEDFVVFGHGQGYRDMSPAIKQFSELLMDGKLEIAKNPCLLWQAKNVTAVMDDAGNIKYSKQKSKYKIDGIIALVMSITAMFSTYGDYDVNKSVEEFLSKDWKI